MAPVATVAATPTAVVATAVYVLTSGVRRHEAGAEHLAPAGILMIRRQGAAAQPKLVRRHSRDGEADTARLLLSAACARIRVVTQLETAP